MKFTLLLAVGLCLVSSVFAQSPTKAAFEASDAANRAAIMASIQGKATPKPQFAMQFWPMTDIYCGSAQSTSNCKFTLAAAENELNMICPVVNGVITPITDILEINIDLANWLNNTTPYAAHRTEFDALFNPSTGYVVTACPGVTLTLNPGFTTGNFNAACASLAGTPNPMVSPANLDTCMTTTTTWLTISGTNYSVYGYLAKQYGSILKRFSVMHEPFSGNNNYTSLNSSWTGTAAQWASFVTDMNAVVHTQCPTCKTTFALDRLEYNWYASMVAATGVQGVGFDDYTTDITNVNTGSNGGTAGGLGTLILLANAATSEGLSFYISEYGQPAWVPAGNFQAAGSSYEDIGNCVWMQDDFARQSTVVKYLLWSALGATDIDNYYSVAQLTTCVFGGPGNGNDKQASGSWPTTFATAAAAGTSTNMLSFFTALYGWPFYTYVAGVPFGI